MSSNISPIIIKLSPKKSSPNISSLESKKENPNLSNNTSPIKAKLSPRKSSPKKRPFWMKEKDGDEKDKLSKLPIFELELMSGMEVDGQADFEDEEVSFRFKKEIGEYPLDDEEVEEPCRKKSHQEDLNSVGNLEENMEKHIENLNSVKSEEEPCRKKSFKPRIKMGENDMSKKQRPATKCENCQEIVKQISVHIIPCNLYYKFMKKTSDGYECQLCSSKTKERFNMYNHIKSKHQKDVNSKGNFEENKEKYSANLNSVKSEELPNISSLESKKENNNQQIQGASDLENKLEKECEKCHEMISIYATVQHSRSCDIYYKYMKKTSDGYDCLLCSKQTIVRFNMYNHLKLKHQKDLNSDGNLEESSNLMPTISSPKSKDQQIQDISLENKPEKKCENCHEMISIYSTVQHNRSCNLYFKFMKKNNDGFECLFCSKVRNGRLAMYKHIKEKHLKNLSGAENVEEEEKCNSTSTNSSPESLKENSSRQIHNSPQKLMKNNPNSVVTNAAFNETEQKNKSKPKKNCEKEETTNGMKQKSILNWFAKV